MPIANPRFGSNLTEIYEKKDVGKLFLCLSHFRAPGIALHKDKQSS